MEWRKPQCLLSSTTTVSPTANGPRGRFLTQCPALVANFRNRKLSRIQLCQKREKRNSAVLVVSHGNVGAATTIIPSGCYKPSQQQNFCSNTFSLGVPNGLPRVFVYSIVHPTKYLYSSPKAPMMSGILRLSLV